MEYRKFENLDLTTSVFGIGCMRLPLQKQPDGSVKTNLIDEPEAIRMIRYGIDHGVTYIDTAWPYHGKESERVVALALREGYRERVALVTKLPCWLATKYEDFDFYLNAQLKKLETDHLDFYLLHDLSRDVWKKVKALGVLDFLDKARKSGRITHAAFSFHDDLTLFKEIVDSYDWDMCQIQLNILDEDYQAGLEGLRYAASRNLGVVIMEPLRGGLLAGPPPPDIQAVWDRAEEKCSQVEWCFRWLADHPEIKVILSGVSTMEQLQDNLRIFDSTRPNMLSPSDYQLIREVQNLYHQKIKVGCTGCNYCMPCPSGVAIPGIFRIYNQVTMTCNPDVLKSGYEYYQTTHQDPGQCVACGQCEAACPQSIPIIQKLIEAGKVLDNL